MKHTKSDLLQMQSLPLSAKILMGKTPQELEREMKAILGGDIKKLG